MKLSSALSLLVPLALLATACGPSARLAAPSGFAHLDGDYDDRVTSPRGVVVGARIEANKPRANLDFWAEAIDLRLRAQGYAPEEPKDVKAKNGIPGKSLRYTYWDGTRQNRYWVDVFATDQRIILVEAAGDKSDFDAAKDQLEATMLDVRVD
jgi:hypothetical protein